MFKCDASNGTDLTTEMLQERSPPEEIKSPATEEKSVNSITPEEEEMHDGKNITHETADDGTDVPRSNLHETGSGLGAVVALSAGHRSGSGSTLVTGSSILSTARITVACTGSSIPIPSSKPSIFSISSILGRPGKCSLPERGRLREAGSAEEVRDDSGRLKTTVVDFEKTALSEERSAVHGLRRGLPVFHDGFMERQAGHDMLIPENWFFWYQQHQKHLAANLDPSTF